MIMRSADRPKARRPFDLRARATLVTTILVTLLAIMIVRDILVRRWSSPPRPSPDVTQRPS
jgi:hypothetical protein